VTAPFFASKSGRNHGRKDNSTGIIAHHRTRIYLCCHLCPGGGETVSELARKIIGDYKVFVERIDKGLKRTAVERSELSMLDHICYRVETQERYVQMLTQCARLGRMLGESNVNGRPIATFEFDEYLRVGKWTIPYLELPAPKKNSTYEEGLEHAEFVIVGSLESFQARHPDIPFTTAGMSKPINPELGMKHDGISVKFHEQQLGAVVRIEQQLELTKVSQS
jgi:predicted metalloenzyme YecM